MIQIGFYIAGLLPPFFAFFFWFLTYPTKLSTNCDYHSYFFRAREAKQKMPRLRVSVGTSLENLVPIHVNSDVPVKIGSDRFEGQVAVYMKGIAGDEWEGTREREREREKERGKGKGERCGYFEERKGVTWSIQVQGGFPVFFFFFWFCSWSSNFLLYPLPVPPSHFFWNKKTHPRFRSLVQKTKGHIRLIDSFLFLFLFGGGGGGINLGRFLQPQNADDILFGNIFERPLKLPWVFGAALRFMKYCIPFSFPFFPSFSRSPLSFPFPPLLHPSGSRSRSILAANHQTCFFYSSPPATSTQHSNTI